MSTTDFDRVDQEILNAIQSDLPLVAEPWEEIGKRIGVDASEVISRTSELKKKNVVRQISAIFDTRRLGYKSTLVAMRFADDHLDEAAQLLNRHPGISHNYARNGHFNLWFTLAVPPGRSLEDEVDNLAKAASALDTRMLPTIRFFKIGVNFDMVKKRSDAKEYFVPDAGRGAQPEGGGSSMRPGEDWNVAQEVTDLDVSFVREMQDDLPLVARPFDEMAERLGMSVDEVLEHAADMKRRGLMRRFSAVLHHRRAGFSSNAMIVWKVPEERAQEVGEIMAQSPAVTHCYQRPLFPDWEYSHFTMVHATSSEECEQVAAEIEEATGIHEKQMLYSTREYKKTRVRYFVEDEFELTTLAAAT